MRQTVTIDGPDEDEIELEVTYTVEPYEYEGTHLFQPGGVYVDSVYRSGKPITLTPEQENQVQDALRKTISIPTYHYNGDY